MDQERLKDLLLEFMEGRLGLDQALERMRHLPYEDLGYAQVDHHRAIRLGFPEVIFGLGKTPEQIIGVASSLLERSSKLLINRGNRATFEPVRAVAENAEFHESCGAITVWRDKTMRGRGVIAVVTAGTSDIAVADEAAVTAEIMGNRVERIFDVGVAGIHRVLSRRKALQSARVIVCVAGMEGALPSVVGRSEER